MVCPFCDGKTSVINSRRQKRNNQIWRRRQCENCAAIFTTTEVIDYSSKVLVNNAGHLEPFLSDRLYTDILLALKHRKQAYSESRELTNNVIQRLLPLHSSPVLETRQISSQVLDVLNHFDKRAGLRYQAERTNL